MSTPRFSPGSRVGNHSIRKFLGNGPLGERYEVFYGSTNHLHCLTVPPEGVADPGYAAYLKMAAPLFREPCLDHPFAAGEDGGVPWLRSELPPGAPEWALASPLDPDLLPKSDRGEATSRDGKRRYLLVPTLADLVKSAGPDLAQKDRDQFLGDVFQGLAALHAAGIPCGPLRPSEIDLDRFARTHSAVARIRYWGVVDDGGRPLPQVLAADLKGAAEFVLVLAAATGGRPSRTDAALRDFARSLDAGEFPTAVEAREALERLFRETGSPYSRHRDPDAAPKPRFVPPDPAPAHGSGPSSSSSGSSARRRASSRRGPSGLELVSAGSEVARRTVQFLRGVFLLLAIVGVGVGVYFYLRWSDERRRLENAIVSADTYNAVSVIPLSLTEAAGAEASGLDGLFEMPPDLLQAEAEAGNALASARLALESVLGAAPGARRAAADAAAPRLAPLLPALAEAGRDDVSAAYLHGYATLLGLGAPADPAAAYRELDDAAARGSARAALLLGDWFASEAPLPPGREGGRLARDREALARYRAAGGELAAPTPLWRAAADRIAAVLRRASAASDFAGDWGAWLRSAALSGHIPSMAVLAVPGPFAPTTPADSLEWLRRIERYPGALPWVRAWAQTRMAAMFAEGSGVPRSDSSARLWYERAAQAGNRTAMLAAAEFFASGRGRNDGRPDPAGAADWRARAAEAPPEPNFDPALLPLSLD